MPRAFDSDDIARHGGPLHFTENVDCPACSITFEGDFYDDSLTVEDIVDAPTGNHTCPACGLRFTTALTGWTFFTEAG